MSDKDQTIKHVDDSNRPYMLSTLDNPFDPWKQFDEWNAFDVGKGYNTNALVARIANVDSDVELELQRVQIELAIDWIFEWIFTPNYIKIYKDQFVDRSKLYEIDDSG